jgi:flagellar export protein FliJ
MPGFVFRLQNVLDYRAGLADRARQELGVLQAHQREAEATLAALLEAEQGALRRLGGAQSVELLDLAEITQLLEYGQVLAQQIGEQRQQVAERRQGVDAQQQRVVALAKDARALETLRERQLEEHQQDDNRREQAEASELASLRHQARHQRLQVQAR